MSDRTAVSDSVAEWAVSSLGGRVGRYESGVAHLILPDTGRAMCGSQLDPARTTMTRSTVLGGHQRWCYSCIGNSLELMEREGH